MTRYLLVSGSFQRTGGQDLANYSLARGLARQGRRVDLVAFHVAADLAREPGVHAHHVPRPLASDLFGGPILAAAGLRAARRAEHVVVNGGNCPVGGSINWVHYVHAAFRSSNRASFVQSAKQRVNGAIDPRTERLALRRARLVVANSNVTRQDLIARVGVPPERITTIYLGTESTLRPPSEEEKAAARSSLGWNDARPRVMFVGALGDRRKGFDTLFRAWQTLATSRDWDAHLVIVGSGAELDAWRARARNAGMERTVSFLGYRKDVPKLLSAADALVSPTRYEPYGLNVHEAISVGLPAIVSADAGVAERYPVSLNDLLLADPEDDVELARKLLAWRSDPHRHSGAIQSLGAELRSWTWDDMTAAFVSAVEVAE